MDELRKRIAAGEAKAEIKFEVRTNGGKPDFEMMVRQKIARMSVGEGLRETSIIYNAPISWPQGLIFTIMLKPVLGVVLVVGIVLCYQAKGRPQSYPASIANPLIREEQKIAVNGGSEAWRLEWKSPPKEAACGPDDIGATTCSVRWIRLRRERPIRPCSHCEYT